MALPVAKLNMQLIVLFIGLFHVTFAVEELVVIHAPDSVRFLSNEPIHSSAVGDVFSAMLAYTVRSNAEWHSLAVVSPWKRPEALVVLDIVGFDNDIDLPLDGNNFLLENAGDLAGQYDLLSLRTEERFFGKKPVLLNMNLNEELHDPKIAQPILLKMVPADPRKRLQLALADVELGELVQESVFNISVPSDVKLLTELVTVKEFMKALSSHKIEIRDGIPDIYWLKLEGLDTISATYGPDSLQIHEALRLLRQIISDVKRVMRDIYDDNVVVAVVKENSIPLSLGHKGRRLLESSTTEVPFNPDRDYNLAIVWGPDFPVIFTIMLFIFIMMVLAVIGISIAMWTMDPGRDSIIYRMTSVRMKKE